MNYEGGSSYGRSGGYGGGYGASGGGSGGGSSRYGGGRSYSGGSANRDPGGQGRATQLGAHDSGFRIGQTVKHARFGQGVIVGLEGSGQDARAQINFQREGTKWLALSVAKLDPV